MMDRDVFESLVARAVSSLPEEFRERLENIDIVIADEPSSRQLAQAGLGGDMTLLGLYEGGCATSPPPQLPL